MKFVAIFFCLPTNKIKNVWKAKTFFTNFFFQIFKRNEKEQKN